MELIIVFYFIAFMIALAVWIWFIVTMNSMLRELREMKVQLVYLGELTDYMASHSFFEDDKKK